MITELINRFKEICRTEKDFPLADKCSFKTGGNAKIAVFPSNVKELSAVIETANVSGVKYAVLGNMTNILVPDEGYDGLLIFTTRLCGKYAEGTEIIAEAGASLTALSVCAGNASLSGLEFAYGIPGTVGGAVFMNAGAYGGSMSDIVKSVKALSPEDGTIREYTNKECLFGYRESKFKKSKEIVISAEIELTNGVKDEIIKKMNINMSARKEKQPLDKPSAGSTFKRPEGYFAGALIESAGLKGFKLGGASVSEKHAGFIINDGNAASGDIENLINYIKKKVYETSGVMLEEEIVYLR